MAKAVALFSGGLDSRLATKLVADQGVEVTAIHFLSVFNGPERPVEELPAYGAAEALGVPIEFVDITEGQLGILKDPAHGFGAAANPCIDCHMLMLSVAADYMRRTGADFIVTGEVVGQRPMSQRRHALEVIDRETGLSGLILRPLSAKALAVTIPEEKGLVDRERLEGITGRSRVRQMELAGRLGITDYPSPAGGCLLTDPGFGARVLEELSHGVLDANGARLLKLGRHYRLESGAKVVVGRNQEENLAIEELALGSDVLLELADIPGPTSLLRGGGEEEIETAAALTARASKAREAASARVRAHRGHDAPYNLRRRGRAAPPARLPKGEVAAPKDDPSADIRARGDVVEVAPATDEVAQKLSVNRQQERMI